MKTAFSHRVVNSLVWMVCGVIVVILRALIIQTSSILAWEILGGGMIAFGAFRLVLAFVERASAESPIP